jgi:HPt (histidine-containing phosphotransfer) domain-containing protein
MPARGEDLIRAIGRFAAAGKEGLVDPATGETPLDLGRLEEISGGDEGFEQELMDEFLGNVPRLLDQAEQAVQRQEAAIGQRAAHTLKGSAAMVGATPLSRAAFALEEAFTQGDMQSATALVLEAHNRFEALSRFAVQHFGEKAA